MRTVVVVRPDIPALSAQPTRWTPSADAFVKCFAGRGWRVVETDRPIRHRPDLVAGYSWRSVMREAHRLWPEIVLFCDVGFWSRDDFMKIALGDRWSPLVEHDYDDTRLRRHGITIRPSRKPGERVLVCGMSEKAAGTWDLKAQEWEQLAVKRLLNAGAEVIYRPKPSWSGKHPIAGAGYDLGPLLEQTLSRVDAVVSHHSNVAIDALAAGLPIYVETGITRALSVPTLEAAIGATAPAYERRARFLRQVAWHQWSMKEIASGAWLEPPAPLAQHAVFAR